MHEPCRNAFGFSRIIGVGAADSEMCSEEMLEDLLVMNKVVVLLVTDKVVVFEDRESLFADRSWGFWFCCLHEVLSWFFFFLACKVAQKSCCELASRSLMILLIENCCVLDDAPTLLLLVRCCYLGSWWQVRSAVAVQRTCQARFVRVLPSMWTEGVSLYCLQDMTMM